MAQMKIHPDANFSPIPFDPVNGPKLLVALGYEVTHLPESWEDVGDSESGPKLTGSAAADVWTRPVESSKDVYHQIVVVDNKIVECGLERIFPSDYIDL